jgi:hypothetical protein
MILMKSKMREALKEGAKLLKKISPLLLSHHPVCSGFQPDMVRKGGRYFCKGCFIGYPFAIFLIAIYLLLAPLFGVELNLNPYLMMVIGVILGCTQILRAMFIDLPPFIKTIQKLMLGAGIALVTVGVLGLGVGSGIKALIFAALVILYGILGLFLRLGYIRRTCRKCEYKEQWEICDGLSFLYKDD